MVVDKPEKKAETVDVTTDGGSNTGKKEKKQELKEELELESKVIYVTDGGREGTTSRHLSSGQRSAI